MIISFAAPVQYLNVPFLNVQDRDQLFARDEFTQWLHNSSSCVLTIYGQVGGIPLRHEIFSYILETKKPVDVATHFVFDTEYPQHANFETFLNSTMAEWIMIDPRIADDHILTDEYQRFKEFGAYNTHDAMYLFLKLRTYDVLGATVLILENDDECPEMGTLFWPHIRHAMDNWERPWKVILLRKASNAPKGPLSAVPHIEITEKQFARSRIVKTYNLLDRVPTVLSDQQLEQQSQYSSQDIRKTNLVLRNLEVSMSNLQIKSDSIASKLETSLYHSPTEIFETIMSQVAQNVRTFLARIIRCVIGAMRPLTHGELDDAASILQEDLPTHEKPRLSTGMFNFLDEHLPGVFVYVYGELRLQHPDLKEFFLRASTSSWYGSEEGEIERLLAQLCLTYLGSPGYVIDTKARLKRLTIESWPHMRHARSSLVVYVTTHWHTHVQRMCERSKVFEQEVFDLLADLVILRNWERGRKTIQNSFTGSVSGTLPELALLASTGLYPVVERWSKSSKQDCTSVQSALAEAIRSGNSKIAMWLLSRHDLTEITELEPVLLIAINHGTEDLCCCLIQASTTTFKDNQWAGRIICRAAMLGFDTLVGLLLDREASSEALFVDLGPLQYAARNNHLRVVQLMLIKRPNLIEVQNQERYPALEMAVKYGHAETAEALIVAGSNINPANSVDRPMFYACYDGKHTVAKILLRYGAEPEYEVTQSEWLPLPIAANFGFTKCVEALLDSERADINCESPGGTALFLAVNNGRMDTARLLLDRGADPNIEANGVSTIENAIIAGNTDMVRLLLECGNFRPEYLGRALHLAARAGTSIELVRLLLHKGADPNEHFHEAPILHAAVRGGNVDILTDLIAKGARVDDVDYEGRTALHLACPNIAMVRTLLEAGAKVNVAMPYFGTTPLHNAVARKEYEAVTEILGSQPDLEARLEPRSSTPGFTPLAIAVWDDDEKMTRLLLEAGADPNARTDREDGSAPLQLSNNVEVVRALLEFKPDIDIQDNDGDTPLNALIQWNRRETSVPVIKLLLRQGCDIEKPNKNGRTPLFNAIRKSTTLIAETLIDHGANLDYVSKSDGTILHATCRYGSFESLQLVLGRVGLIDQPHPKAGNIATAVCLRPQGEDIDVIKTLNYLRDYSLESELDINGKCEPYGCAIGAACFRREESVVDWFLDQHANLVVEDYAGRRPIHFVAYRSVELFDKIHVDGTDFSSRDKMGRSVLHIAVQSASHDLVRHVLLKDPSLLNALDCDGWTPLHYAVRGMRHYRDQEVWCSDDHGVEVVKLLLDGNNHVNTDVKVLHQEPPWSILKLARFHRASLHIRKLLRAYLIEQQGEAWNPSLHETPRAYDDHPQYLFCDHCFIVSLTLSSDGKPANRS